MLTFCNMGIDNPTTVTTLHILRSQYFDYNT